MAEEPIHGSNEGVDAAMAMVSRDVIMELLPESLDDVVVRRVRRQEVQHDAPGELGELCGHHFCLVDDVVVEHQMDALRTPITAAQVEQELDEHFGGLVLADAVDDGAGVGIEGSEDVAFDVLAGRQDHRLLPGFQVSRPDLRIDMDIGLVLIEDFLFGRRA